MGLQDAFALPQRGLATHVPGARPRIVPKHLGRVPLLRLCNAQRQQSALEGQGGATREAGGATADLGIGVSAANEVPFTLNVGAEPLVPLA